MKFEINKEKNFKIWLYKQNKVKEEPYSDKDRIRYISAIKAVTGEFPKELEPYGTMFNINTTNELDAFVASIKGTERFKEFNRSRGDGLLDKCINLYRRFLTQPTPEWFKKKAEDYPTFDGHAEAILLKFQDRFDWEKLELLREDEILKNIFHNDEEIKDDNDEEIKDDLCHRLASKEINDIFGSIGPGNPHKFGLQCVKVKEEKQWKFGTYTSEIVNITPAEALKEGKEIRDFLVESAKVIEGYRALETIGDYKNLYRELKDLNDKRPANRKDNLLERVWILKYYHMLFPKFFAPIYKVDSQSKVLSAIGEKKEAKEQLVCMGQIRLYADKCKISNVMFNKIFYNDYIKDYGDNKNYETSQDIIHNTKYHQNRILFGAPGTGKSFILNEDKNKLLAKGGDYERVTFHPDYSYANFVGTYKPVPCKDSDDKNAITYSYVPGPFMRIYVKALLNAPKPYLMVIEEINRANVAAVFGDVFQLLDRGNDGISQYPIQASDDIKNYLAREMGGNPEDYSEIRIPHNMYIWATMNSADQGVFPLDTAFKRRWDFTYLGINEREKEIDEKEFTLVQGSNSCIVKWNKLRKAINDQLMSYNINEDKLMGPFFISEENLSDGEFNRIFKNKVIMYLFNDAAKHKRKDLFRGCDKNTWNQYSEICRKFDTNGVEIFCTEISDKFKVKGTVEKKDDIE